MKKYIASDFHNGNDVADYDRVMGFLELVDGDADELLILGDFEELLWSNMNILTTVAPYRYVTEKVKDIASRKKVSYVIGNHDWNIGLFSSLIEPVKVAQPFAEGGVFYTHGHEYDWLAIITGTPIDPIYWAVAFPFVLPTQLLLRLATKVWAEAEDEYSWSIGVINRFAAKAARERGCHTVTLGHTHFPQDTEGDGIRIVNTGDMLDSYSYLVQTDSELELRYFL